MRETSFERVLAVGTFLAAAAIVVMVATRWEALSDSAVAVTGRPLIGEQAPAENVSSPRRASSPAGELAAFRRTEPKRVQAASPPGRAVLVIAATRGPSWLEARAGNSTGAQLYFGTLDRGATTEFDRLPVWVRLGAAESVDIRLGSSLIESLPIADNGVAQFVASAEGVAAVSR
jgi:hypothetical protein